MSGSRAKQIKKFVIESHGALPWRKYVQGTGGAVVNAGLGGAYRKAKALYTRMKSL